MALSKLRHASGHTKGDSRFRPITAFEPATISSIDVEGSAESAADLFPFFSILPPLVLEIQSRNPVKVQVN